MNNLRDLDLQIISKYLNISDVVNLLKLNPDLKYYYHTTFNLIKIKDLQIIPEYHAKKIINILESIFPNLEEIILNIDYNIVIIYEDFKPILENWLNFSNNTKLPVKINFTNKLILHYEFIEDGILHYIINSIVVNLDNIYFASYLPVDEDSCNNLIRICNKYKNYKHIFEINKMNDINLLKSVIQDDQDDQNAQNVQTDHDLLNENENTNSHSSFISDNLYVFVPNYSNYDNEYRKLIFPFSDIDNSYVKNYIHWSENRSLMINIHYAEYYYRIMKLRSKISNENGIECDVVYFNNDDEHIVTQITNEDKLYITKDFLKGKIDVVYKKLRNHHLRYIQYDGYIYFSHLPYILLDENLDKNVQLVKRIGRNRIEFVGIHNFWKFNRINMNNIKFDSDYFSIIDENRI